MLPRVLEPEVMDTPDDASAYDAMDHSHVNRQFAADFLAFASSLAGTILDVGTGTARIPIEICRQSAHARIVSIDLAEEMLKLAAINVRQSGFADRIRLGSANARSLPYVNGEFAMVISNSIMHHIPDPYECFVEMARVCAPNGVLFVRDLFRPASDDALAHIVRTYAGDDNEHQRQLFSDSLRAALTLAEVQTLVAQLGFDSATVLQTSDRHWTWATRV